VKLFPATNTSYQQKQRAGIIPAFLFGSCQEIRQQRKREKKQKRKRNINIIDIVRL